MTSMISSSTSRGNHSFSLSPLKTTVISTGAIVTTWYILDPTDLIQKIGTTALGALVLQANSWVPYLRRQLELMAIGGRELQHWKQSYASFMNLKIANQLGQPNVNYSDYLNKQYENGKKWDTAENYRLSVRPGAIKLIHEIVAKHIIEGSQILEIGSNKLDDQGFSVLGRLLPEKHLENLTYSDYIHSTVQEEAKKVKKTKSAYKLLDLRNPDEASHNSQDCLMALNVVDVISRKHLRKITAGASKLLKNQGRVILLADRPLEMAPQFAELSRSEDFVFPWTVSFKGKATIIKRGKGDSHGCDKKNS